jgi:hypothetical protein
MEKKRYRGVGFYTMLFTGIIMTVNGFVTEPQMLSSRSNQIKVKTK